MKSLSYLAVSLNSTDGLDSKAFNRVAVIEFTERLRARQTAFSARDALNFLLQTALSANTGAVFVSFRISVAATARADWSASSMAARFVAG